MERKLKEAILAIRIERAYSKDKILELYLNEIYFGIGAYGIAAASLSYFNKELQDLTVEEVAYLAALPEGPQQLPSVPAREAGADPAQLDHRPDAGERLHHGRGSGERPRPSRSASTSARPARTSSPPISSPRKSGARCWRSSARTSSTTAACRCARRSIPRLQQAARRSLMDGLVQFDRTQGLARPGDQARHLRRLGQGRSTRSKAPTDIQPWRLGVVLKTEATKAVVGLRPEKQQDGSLVGKREAVEITFDEMKWAKSASKKVAPKAVADVITPGDVIYVAPKDAEQRRRRLVADADPGGRRRHRRAWTPTPAACSPWSAASRSP